MPKIRRQTLLLCAILVLLLYLLLWETPHGKLSIFKGRTRDMSVGDVTCDQLLSPRLLSSVSFDFEEKPISISSDGQSTFTCSGDMNHESGWHWRTCAFKNICYNKGKHEFQFYKSPNFSRKPILFEPKHGHLYDFRFGKHGFVSLVARGQETETWAPTIVDRILPSKKEAIYLEQVHTLFMHWVVPYNPGHVIWEDIGNNYYSMVRLGEYNRNAVLMEYRSFPQNGTIFEQMYRVLVPTFAASVVDLKAYVNQFHTTDVCFRTVVTGGATPMYSSSLHGFNHGKEQIFYDYRSRILRYHGVDLSRLPTSHRILLVNKTQALRKSARAIKNLVQVEEFIRTTYPHIPLKIVEWQKIPFVQQLHILYKTTLLITSCGGISSIVPFLPDGAHAIITDYYVNKAPKFPTTIWKQNESASMDASLWNFFPHVHKLYYQIRSPNEYVFDFPGGEDARYDASIIIKMDRLKELIDTALDSV